MGQEIVSLLQRTRTALEGARNNSGTTDFPDRIKHAVFSALDGAYHVSDFFALGGTGLEWTRLQAWIQHFNDIFSTDMRERSHKRNAVAGHCRQFLNMTEEVEGSDGDDK